MSHTRWNEDVQEETEENTDNTESTRPSLLCHRTQSTHRDCRHRSRDLLAGTDVGRRT